MKLFLDDERFPPGEDISGWVICRTSAGAIDFVKTCGWPSFISFDHDLGGDDTAMTFVDWITTQVLDEGRANLPFDYFVHSQNPIGAENIQVKLDNLSYFLEQENWN